MSTTAIVLIICLVLGIIVGNLLLLRRSTGFKQKKTPDKPKAPASDKNSDEKNKHAYRNSFDDEDDDW